MVGVEGSATQIDDESLSSFQLTSKLPRSATCSKQSNMAGMGQAVGLVWEVLMGETWKWNTSFLPTSHWLELGHTPSDYKAQLGHWLCAEVKGEVGLVGSQPISVTGKGMSEHLG